MNTFQPSLVPSSLVPKLRLATHFLEAPLRVKRRGTPADGGAMQSFAERHSQAGAWERGNSPLLEAPGATPTALRGRVFERQTDQEARLLGEAGLLGAFARRRKAHAKPWSWHPVRIVLAAALVIAASVPSRAQEATLARTAAKEVLEILSTQAEKQGVKSAAESLAEFGGEAAVRQTMEQVARETGEEGVVNVVRLSKSYGIDAIKAAKVAPKLTANFVDRVSPELAPGALRALARQIGRAHV